MSFLKYDINISETLYAEFEELRKKFRGEHLTKADIEELLGGLGFPNTPKMWELVKKCELVQQYGKARNTYYLLPIEQIPYSRFEYLEKLYYNGMSLKVHKPSVPKDKENKRIPLSEEFCIDFLKKTGKYLIFEVTPNVEKLKGVLNPHYLLDSSDVKMK